MLKSKQAHVLTASKCIRMVTQPKIYVSETDTDGKYGIAWKVFSLFIYTGA